LIGLAPLLRRRYWYGNALPFRRLELLASGEKDQHGIYSNHLSILAERGFEEEVAQRLAHGISHGAFGCWDEVVLPMMAGDTVMPALLARAFRAAGLIAEMKETARAPYIELPPTWDAYLQGLGPNSRRNIQRSQKAFDAWCGGTTRLESATTPADLAKGKQVLVNLHHQRWESDDQPGVFRSPFYLRFHDAIMQRLAEQGELELHWLCARDEPVAVFYGMAWQGKIYAYQMGRRMDLPGHLRPGAVLLAMVIRSAIESGRREFDLLADESFYKHQFTSTVRPLVHVRATRTSLREWARRGVRSCVRSLRCLRGAAKATSS
jgi:CelD/BcsL family acetyltransferase involved in cellulose biosynthesis